MKITPKSYIFLITIITFIRSFKALLTTPLNIKFCIHTIRRVCSNFPTTIITRKIMAFFFISYVISLHSLFLLPINTFFWSIPIWTLTLWTNTRIGFLSWYPLVCTAFTFISLQHNFCHILVYY